MEKVREFIEEALEEYNSGRLTPMKLHEMEKTYEIPFSLEYGNNLKNLQRAYNMLNDMFREQKGEKILKKVDFEWKEVEKFSNSYYDDQKF